VDQALGSTSRVQQLEFTSQSFPQCLNHATRWPVLLQESKCIEVKSRESHKENKGCSLGLIDHFKIPYKYLKHPENGVYSVMLKGYITNKPMGEGNRVIEYTKYRAR